MNQEREICQYKGHLFDITFPITEHGVEFIENFKNYQDGPLDHLGKWGDLADALEGKDIGEILPRVPSPYMKFTLSTDKNTGAFLVRWMSIILFKAPYVGKVSATMGFVGKLFKK